jgi:hypothetical protein
MPENLFSYSAWPALLAHGRQVVLRGAAPCCLQGQAARRRMAAMGKQPEGPGLFARAAASSFGRGSTSTPSLFLAAQTNRPGAGHAEYENRF